MPINDSAGVGVYLEDKSQRASTAVGFRSAAAIEADRGLCNKPVLISSDADYVKVFGSPSMERHGAASMEAYMLSQLKVPQVITRAKNPLLDGNSQPFGAMSFGLSDKVLEMRTDLKANEPKAPVEADSTFFYFKGEGTYCSSKVSDAAGNKPNIVVRFSVPTTQSAYAKAGRTLHLQVFDFAGADHIDEDREAILAFNPDVSTMLNGSGEFFVDGYDVNTQSDNVVTLTAFVNGRVGNVEFHYSDIHSSTGRGHDNGVFDWFADAMLDAKDSKGHPIINEDWTGGAGIVYAPGDDGSGVDASSNNTGYYVLDSRSEDEVTHQLSRQQLNCFGLSVSLTASVELPISQLPGGRKLTAGFYSFACGSVTISGNDSTGYTARFSLNTNLYLRNRNDYMFMGEQNEYWASYYYSYCKENYDISLSYDDFDANNISMQADAVLAGSNYLISKTSDTFGDYTIDYDKDDITTKLHYFDAFGIDSNEILVQNKSYAYSQALLGLLGDNLVRWRCVATPNLGDIMNTADYLSAITGANECTLGLSNIGRAASVNVFENLSGRHGNRFITDYSQYGYRTLAGKRTAVTMAALVTDVLNRHYNQGIEARPPFGYNYGQVSCLSLSQEFSGPERNMLKNQFKINPVIEDGGFYLWGQRTSQLTDTSLSDISSIISYVWMKFAIYDAMKAFVAEYNDPDTVKDGLRVLKSLNATFINKKYIEDGIPSADRNVLGDSVLRFDYAVKFKGVSDYVDIYVTAYSQTQTLSVSLSQEA